MQITDYSLLIIDHIDCYTVANYVATLLSFTMSASMKNYKYTKLLKGDF